MNYKVLRSQYIRLQSKQELEFNAGEGYVIIPQDDAKIYLHWQNPNGKLVSSLTLSTPTSIFNTVKIINSSNSVACILTIVL